MIKNNELEKLINTKLNSLKYSDCTPNGLQVEGKKVIKKIITGVTANQELINEAVRQNADAVIVHHGYFWKGESQVINGIKRRRLKTLLENEINLYSWHLPLDVHPELGNNIQLAKILNINVMGKIEPLLLWGELQIPISGSELALHIETNLSNRCLLWYGNSGPDLIKRVAWCTGRGQDLISNAAHFGIDAFITGEVSEQTIHYAHEYKLHFYAAGHHATECGGIRALSKWLNENKNINVLFIDIPNPA